jgi:hypothetical protein
MISRQDFVMLQYRVGLLVSLKLSYMQLGAQHCLCSNRSAVPLTFVLKLALYFRVTEVDSVAHP